MKIASGVNGPASNCIAGRAGDASIIMTGEEPWSSDLDRLGEIDAFLLSAPREREERGPKVRKLPFGVLVGLGVGMDDTLRRCVSFAGVDVEKGVKGELLSPLLFGCLGPNGSILRKERNLGIPELPADAGEEGADVFKLGVDEAEDGLGCKGLFCRVDGREDGRRENWGKPSAWESVFRDAA